MEKRRKIFDDGAATVEEVSVSAPKKKPELNVNSTTINRNLLKKTVSVGDVIDTFAGYLPSQANFMPKDGGECLLCGKTTTSSMRKICFDCLQNQGENLYLKAKKSFEMGDKEFQV